MLRRLIHMIRNLLGKNRPARRQPLYDAQDPRRLARQRSNRIYLKNIKQHQKAEKRKHT